MGKLLEFAIFVGSQTLTQEGKKNITGQVILNLKEPMKMRALTLKLTGEVYCHWTEQRGTDELRRTFHFTEKEELLDMTSYLYGEGSESSMHPSGRFSYPFVFVVPQHLPTSFDGTYGHIKYGLEASIDRPCKFDHDIKQPLQIIEIIDTNKEEFLKRSGDSKSSEVGCCFRSGMLSLDAHLSRTAFCPGESIMLNATANNQSRTNLRGLKARLCKIIKFQAKSKTQTEEYVLSKTTGLKILKGEKGTFVNHPLHVPATEPTINNKFIKCYYVVRIKVDAGWASDLEISIPVTIGNVPFRGNYGVVNHPATFAAPAPIFGMPVAPQPPPFQMFPSVPMGIQPQAAPVPPPIGFIVDNNRPPLAPPPCHHVAVAPPVGTQSDAEPLLPAVGLSADNNAPPLAE
eukprot:gene20081-22051_t